jgi:hypothetical protein
MPLLALPDNPNDWIDAVEKFAKLIGLDPTYLKYVWWAMLLVFVLWFGPWLFKLVKEKWVDPWRLSPGEKRRLARRQQFASDVEGRIRDINSKEEWRDTRFTELEAEVEAEGERRAFSLIPFITRTRSGLRKEKSLSRAIELSRERLIQMEGEPGSGKSVALRFLARSMAYRTAHSRSLTRPIPLYLNLKELNRGQGEAVGPDLIKRFVLESLTRNALRDVEEYIEKEFKRGMEEGTWLFLFDSFDELPDVLSSTEADATIRSYADAISDFLGGMNRCRGVVASRHFRGPGQSRWPRFRILPLSEKRRLRLVRQALLEPAVEQKIRAHLEDPTPDARNMFGNPMLLGLLCEHMKGGNDFPENVHTVLASYLEHRLNRDGERVRRRYQVSPADVRAAAEAAAFCMTADAGLGLSPTRTQLKLAMTHQDIKAANNIDTLLDALIFIKIARAEGVSGSETITFAHRRFQEYFATCVVLREPGRISARALLMDARWRETAVVICQSQPSELLSPLVEEARRVVDEIMGALRPAYGEVRGAAARAESDKEVKAAHAAAAAARVVDETGSQKVAGEPPPRERFLWPAGALHVLSLLQEGFRRRLADLPADIRGDIGDALHVVETKAALYDRKCALEVAGVAPENILLGLLRNCFASDSQLLKNIAYRQAANLFRVPDDIAEAIRQAVFNLALSGRLRRERFATRAHLTRLEKPERFISALNLLLVLPTVDLFLHAAALISLLALAAWQSGALLPWNGWVLLSAVLLFASHAYLRTLFTSRMKVRGLQVWLFFVYLRFGFLLAASRVITRPESGSVFPRNLYLAFSVYIMTWSISALYAARRGRHTSLGWWPVMPLTPLLIIIRALGEYLRGVSTWETIKKLLGDLKKLRPISVLKDVLVALVTLTLEIIGIGLFALVMPIVLISMVFGILKDWLRWRKRHRAYFEPLTGLEFVNELSGYLHSAAALRYLKTVRVRGQLLAVGETDEILEKLSLAIERERHSNATDEAESGHAFILVILRALISGMRRRRVTTLQNLDGFDEWYTRTLMESPLTGTSRSSEILDELVLLMEQVRANRRDWPASEPIPATANAGAPAVVRV